MLAPNTRFCRKQHRANAAIEMTLGSPALLQGIAEQRQRLPTVTHEILPGRYKFRSGLPKYRIQEQWIVAKTAGTARRPQDFPPPQPFRDQRLRILRVPHDHDDAVTVRLPVLPIADHFEQFCVVALVRPGFSRITRAM